MTPIVPRHHEAAGRCQAQAEVVSISAGACIGVSWPTMFGEIAYCDKADCRERRIPTAASLFFAVLGSAAVCAAFLGPRLFVLPGGFATEPVSHIIGGSLLVMTITGTFAAYEKFRHPLLAFVFGASLPGLLLGLAVIAADSAPGG